MQRHIAPLSLVVALAVTAVATAATPSPTAVKAAHDATQEAKALTYQLMSHEGTNMGTVTLQRIGRTHSRVTVRLLNPAAAGTRVTLHTGRQCHDPHVAASAPIALNPVSQQVSQTVVALPLNNLQSGNYMVDVQNATARSQFAAACAKLNGGVP